MTLTMPAYEFPREMPLRGGLHPFESATFEPSYGQVRAPTRGSRVQVANVAPSLWTMEFTSHLMEMGEAQVYLAWLQSLRGGARAFKAWHPMCRFPQAYPDGWGSLPFDGKGTLSSIDAARDRITVSGLPSGFKLTPGDMLSIPLGNTGRTLHRVMMPVTASGIGSAVIIVEPTIPLSLTVSEPAQEVLFEKPWCLAVVDAESIRGPWSSGTLGRVSFSAVQTY